MDGDSNSERRTKQKRDPAWNYCEMYKSGDRVQLKCVFCGKIFKGGGIHRVKEHLAGAKGDGGSPCMSVDPDVRLAMQENLNGVVGKRRKKQRFFDAEEMLNHDDGNTDDYGLPSNYDLNSGVDLLQVADGLETSSSNMAKHDSGSKETSGRVRKGKIVRTRTRIEQENTNVYKLDSNLEPVPIGSLKRDAAWKHCQMFKNGDKVLLQCLYCGKIFNGGGIYRIKEHLAGRIGNGSVCAKVLPDVRLLMQESLNVKGFVVKKKKKQRRALEMLNHDPGTSEVHNLIDRCDLNSDIDLLAVPDTLEQDKHMFLNGDCESKRMGGRIENRQLGKAPVFANPLNFRLFASEGNATIDLRTASDHVQMAIGRFMFYAGIPFDAINSLYFQRMVAAIASQGSHVVRPSCNDLRSWILKNSVQEVKSQFDQFSSCWERSGCSVLVDEWVTEKGRTLLNILVNCLEGNLFLKSVDISDIKTSTDALYEVLEKVIEEVGVRNVLQVITSSEERYIVVGKRLTDYNPSILWTPCAVHCINLMLEDFKKIQWVTAMLEQAKSITRFIYNHNVVLNMMRRYSFGVDLIDIGITQSATDFMTLNRIVSVKQNLQHMVASEEWVESPYSREPEGLAVIDFFSSESFWSTCALISRLTHPFLRLLRIVGSEKRPAMGYVYAGLYRAKETIKKELVHQKDYLVYWNIIDQRWEQLRHHPLLGAGFYLNPKYFYSAGGDMHHIRPLLYDCVEKLVPDQNIQDKIVKETINYQNAVGDFGRKMAVRARDSLLPAEWWSTYGAACPNLARLAVRILSQTCSSMSRKPNHIPLEQMHEAKNSLEHQRLRDLVFVQYNWWLMEGAQKKDQEPVDPISYTSPSVVEDWITKKESCSKDQTSSDWTTVAPPLGNLLIGSSVDDFEALGSGFDDYEILNGVRDIEEENSDKPVEF